VRAIGGEIGGVGTRGGGDGTGEEPTGRGIDEGTDSDDRAWQIEIGGDGLLYEL